MLYIHLLSTKLKGGYSEENTRKVFTTLIVRVTHPQERNSCTLFSPLSHCYTLRGDLYLNTIHTYSEYCREFFGAWKALGVCQKKLVRLGGAIGQYCRILITSEDKNPRSPLVFGAWRAQVFWID